jgi:NhaP-type Na+/H+ or K+/H+ antiporter
METFILVGGAAFGLVVGWVTYGFLRRNDRKNLTDLSAIIGAIGGAAVTGLFQPATGAFAAYCVGLAAGFFGYLIFYMIFKQSAPDWLGEAPTGGGGTTRPNAPR